MPSTDYFDGYETLEVEVFEMVIAVADNPGGGRLPADDRTAPTIFTIFEHFFFLTVMLSSSFAIHRMGANGHVFASLDGGSITERQWVPTLI